MMRRFFIKRFFEVRLDYILFGLLPFFKKKSLKRNSSRIIIYISKMTDIFFVNKNIFLPSVATCIWWRKKCLELEFHSIL